MMQCNQWGRKNLDFFLKIRSKFIQNRFKNSESRWIAISNLKAQLLSAFQRKPFFKLEHLKLLPASAYDTTCYLSTMAVFELHCKTTFDKSNYWETTLCVVNSYFRILGGSKSPVNKFQSCNFRESTKYCFDVCWISKLFCYLGHGFCTTWKRRKNNIRRSKNGSTWHNSLSRNLFPTCFICLNLFMQYVT